MSWPSSNLARPLGLDRYTHGSGWVVTVSSSESTTTDVTAWYTRATRIFQHRINWLIHREAGWDPQPPWPSEDNALQHRVCSFLKSVQHLLMCHSMGVVESLLYTSEVIRRLQMMFAGDIVRIFLTVKCMIFSKIIKYFDIANFICVPRIRK